MRLIWKKRRSDDGRSHEPTENQAPAKQVLDAGEADPDPEIDTITAAKEARQRIHISETTNWRYTSGLW